MSKKQCFGSTKNITAVAVGLLIVASHQAHAGGFALNDQSATFLGTAYTGTSSAIEDASTGYYNPAGLSELCYSQALVSGTYINRDVKLENGTARNSLGALITGNNPTKPKANFFTGGGHLAWRVNKKLSFGFSVIEPFGQDIRYSNTDIARLMVTDYKITTVDLSPTFGYKFNHDFSVGAGLDFVKTNTTISSGVAWANAGPEANGYVINSANDWSLGYHVGILVKPWNNNKMGLVYFSKLDPKLSGTTQYSQTLDFGTPNSVNYTLNLPDRLNYSVTQGFSNRFRAMAEVEWTHWSRMKTMTLNYNSTGLPGIQTYNFRNTWRVGLGGDFNATQQLVIKAGLGYDQSPTTNTYRTAAIPDADRYLIAVGLKFAFNKYLAVTGGYSHAFYRSVTIAETGLNNALNRSPIDPNLSTLNANLKNSADIFGLQLSWNFA